MAAHDDPKVGRLVRNPVDQTAAERVATTQKPVPEQAHCAVQAPDEPPGNADRNSSGDKWIGVRSPEVLIQSS